MVDKAIVRVDKKDLLFKVDFDDGHCPSWRNQLLGWHNIYRVVEDLDSKPVLMLRPRAWNMTDQCVKVDGKKVPGALLDFAVLMFHCGKQLAQSGGSFNDRKDFHMGRDRGCIAQRKHSCFSPTSPGFDSQHSQKFMTMLLRFIAGAV